MHGSIAVPFSELFASTVEVHGAGWAAQYYSGRGMPAWELAFWFRSIGNDETRWFWMR